MKFSELGIRARAIIATTGLVAGLLACSAGSATAAVSCPSVDPSTGAMTPAPGLDADLSGCNLTGADFFGLNISGGNLSNANLTDADLLSANVEGVNFSDANLSGANMTGDKLVSATVTGAIMGTTTLTGVWTFNTVGVPASLPSGWTDIDDYILGPTAVLTYAILSGADLAGLDLDQAGLDDADLQGADLAGTDLASAYLSGVQSGGVTGTPAPTLPGGWDLVDGYLVGSAANLDGAKLSGADLAGLNLSQAALTGADLSSADLADANLQATDADSANLTDANLTDASLTPLNETPVNLDTANLTGANLTGADLTGASLTGADLANTDLSQATLTGVASGGITGSPVLPANWALQGGYLLGPSADLTSAALSGITLTGAVLTDASLTQADLSGAALPSGDFSGADLSSANLTGATLTDGNFSNATLTDANLTNANLDGATTTGASWTGATWLNTTCPDGTNSNSYDSGCFSPLNTEPPVASPGLGTGGTYVNGWYNAPVTVFWNWSDAGPINWAKCPRYSTTTGNGPVTFHVTCTDLAGNVGTASISLKVDASLPAVMVTGVAEGHHYAAGRVPAAGCKTTESVSGVETAASLSVTTGGTNGVGPFTATCSGAVSVAGNAQAGPVRAIYSVGYGFGGFLTPAHGSTVSKSAGRVTVSFRLLSASGKPIPAATARALSWAQDTRVVLSGPGIRPVSSFCSWSASARAMTCTLKIPAKARTGRKYRYTLTAQEDLGALFYAVPAFGRATSSLSVFFR